MLLFTGDIHGGIDIHKLRNKNVPHYNFLSRNDFVIICGDFGLIWNGSAEEKYWLKWINEKPYTTVFCDGNHENFDKINQYPIITWNGGNVHQIADNVFHLMRGQAFNLDGRSIFVMGGASSHDKEYRQEGLNWWKEELPSEDEYRIAKETLKKNGYSFDFIVTHCAPTNIEKEIMGYRGKTVSGDRLTDFLQDIEPNLSYRRWFCGHYHRDYYSHINPAFEVLYDRITVY